MQQRFLPRLNYAIPLQKLPLSNHKNFTAPSTLLLKPQRLSPLQWCQREATLRLSLTSQFGS
jgi:hypothetical protein